MTDNTPPIHDAVETLQTELINIPTNTPTGEPIITSEHNWDIKDTISTLHMSVFNSNINENRGFVIIDATDPIDDVLTTLANTHTLTTEQKHVVEDLTELVTNPQTRPLDEYEQLIDDYKTRIETHDLDPELHEYELFPPDTDLSPDEKTEVLENIGNAVKADCDYEQ